MLRHPGTSKNRKPLPPWDVGNWRNITKWFKLSCGKLAASFRSTEVRNSHFTAFIHVLTSNTYVVVVTSDPPIPSADMLINAHKASKHFEKLERADGPQHSLILHQILPRALSENADLPFFFTSFLFLNTHNVVCL